LRPEAEHPDGPEDEVGVSGRHQDVEELSDQGLVVGREVGLGVGLGDAERCEQPRQERRLVALAAGERSIAPRGRRSDRRMEPVVEREGDLAGPVGRDQGIERDPGSREGEQQSNMVDVAGLEQSGHRWLDRTGRDQPLDLRDIDPEPLRQLLRGDPHRPIVLDRPRVSRTS